MVARLSGERRTATRGRRSQRYAPISELGSLEQRLLMAAQPAFDIAEHRIAYEPAVSAEPTSVLAEASAAMSPLASLPLLNSYPGAAAQLYLDFDGDSARTWGDFYATRTPAYDVDGDASTFSDAELVAINEIWERIAEKYSPFNINVTTVNPGTLANGYALRVVIGGDGTWTEQSCGGLAYVGSFTNSDPNTVYVFSDNLAGGQPIYVAEAAAHEAGHAFGLDHQSLYNSRGHLVEEYNSGDGDVAPIMGDSYDANRGLWWLGPSTSATTQQDDMAVLAGARNGFGYRPDDHGNDMATASRLNGSAGKVWGQGVIERTSDADWFSFLADDGMVSFTINPAAVGPMLDLQAELIKSDGTVLASAATYDLGEVLTAEVEAGTYYLVIKSNGLYGDVGQYFITGEIAEVELLIPLTPTGVSATAKSGGRVWVAWDSQLDAEEYIIERSLDGKQWDTLTIVPTGTAGVWDRNLAAGQTCYYRVAASNAAGISDSSEVVSAVALPGAPPMTPGRLRITTLGPTRLRLTWIDKSDDEKGFHIYRSSDGLRWNAIARVAANRSSLNLTVNQKRRIYFRVSAYNENGISGFTTPASTLMSAASKRSSIKKTEAVFATTLLQNALDF